MFQALNICDRAFARLHGNVDHHTELVNLNIIGCSSLQFVFHFNITNLIVQGRSDIIDSKFYNVFVTDNVVVMAGTRSHKAML